MIDIAARSRLIRMAALAGLCAGLLSACAEMPAAKPQFMPMGSATLAPHGFLQFCQREPQQCGQPRAAELRSDKEMMQQQWAAVFGLAAPAASPPAQAPVAAAAAPALGAEPETVISPAAPIQLASIGDLPMLPIQPQASQPGGFDWNSVFNAPRMRIAWGDMGAHRLLYSPLSRYLAAADLPQAPIAQPAPLDGAAEGAAILTPPAAALAVDTLTRVETLPPAPYQQAAATGAQPAVTPAGSATGGAAASPLRLDNALMERLLRVNARVNALITPMSDVEAFGADDVWTLPIEAGGPARGNCKHYALEKQRALIEAGAPAADLSLAIVRTRFGEMHAVLLVSTDHGELVLDNLTEAVMSWRDVDYTWLERQKPGQPMIWVALETSGSRQQD